MLVRDDGTIINLYPSKDLVAKKKKNRYAIVYAFLIVLLAFYLMFV